MSRPENDYIRKILKENKMTVDQYIQKTKDNPENYTGYCEIIMTESGGIIEVCPSHTQTLVYILCEKEDITVEEFQERFPVHLSIIHYICEKYHLCCIWRNKIIHPKQINRFQKIALEKLVRANCISTFASGEIAHEYSYYLAHKDECDKNLPKDFDERLKRRKDEETNAGMVN